jgi:hypothetical protein
MRVCVSQAHLADAVAVQADVGVAATSDASARQFRRHERLHALPNGRRNLRAVHLQPAIVPACANVHFSVSHPVTS